MVTITKVAEKSNYLSYEFILNALAEKANNVPKESGTVNIIGIGPSIDAFWRGNLQEIKRILNKLGLTVNTFFNGKTLNELTTAELNVVLSPWLGISAAKKFRNKLKTPYIVNPLPIGIKETSNFIEQIGNTLLLDVQEVIEEEELESYKAIKNGGKLLSDYEIPLSFATITDSNYAIGLNRFLTNEFGWIPTTSIILDQVPLAYHQSIKNYLNLKHGISTNIVYETNPGKIWNLIKNENPSVILGRSIDNYIAKKIGGINLSVSYPLRDRMILNKGYIGYKGTVNLIEDLLTLILTNA